MDRRDRRKLLVVVFLVSLSQFSDALCQQISFAHFTAENGLSNNAVLSIAQDSRGFMWFGTGIGLNRYDGYRFKVYKSNPRDPNSISNSNVISILSDSRGNLWAGTSGGLNRYNPQTDNFTRMMLSSSNAAVHCVYEDSRKNLWAGTANGLYLRVNENTFKRFYAPDSATGAGKTIRALYEDHDGNLWIGTNNGLVRMRTVNGRPEYLLFSHSNNDPGSLCGNFVTTITEDRQKNLWIGTQNSGICVYNAGTHRFTTLPAAGSQATNNIRKLFRDEAGRMWAGTQEGLRIINASRDSTVWLRHNASDSKSLSQNSVYSICRDHHGTIWVGTYFGGVNAVFPFTTSFTVIRNSESGNSLSNNVISSMVEDGSGDLWIGTEGGGLNHLSKASGQFTAYANRAGDNTSIGSNLIKVVYRDADANIWAGTHGGGLNVFDRTGQRFERFFYGSDDEGALNLEVIALFEDSRGRFWIGTNSGLRIFARKERRLEPWSGKPLPPALGNSPTRAIIEDRKHRVWLGTNNGLFLFNADSAHRVSPDYINSIHEDADGNIWAGCYYGGLLKVNDKLETTRYNEKEGLPNSNVIGILEDDDHNLWLSTDNGLVKFNDRRKDFHRYTVSDGIADNAFNYNAFLRDSRGRLLFGGYNGITAFNPSQIQENHFTPPVVFTGL